MFNLDFIYAIKNMRNEKNQIISALYLNNLLLAKALIEQP